MKRPATIGAVGAGFMVLVTATPFLLSQLPFFRVRQIEVIGARYLAPTAVIAAAGVQLDQSLFDRLAPMESRLQALPGLVDASVGRRLPGTLRIEVTERLPVALVPGPAGMIVLDRAAQPLPFDPARTEIDLPVVGRPDSVLTTVLATVVATDPELYARVDLAERTPGGVVLRLGPKRLILTATPTLEQVRNVGAVWRHVVETGRDFGEIDGRFAGMVILRGRTG